MKEVKPFYRSIRWKNKGARILRRNGYMCQAAEPLQKNEMFLFTFLPKSYIIEKVRRGVAQFG